MNLTETRTLTKIEMDISGKPVIFIQHENQILRDGELIHSVPHRSAVAVNDAAKINELLGLSGVGEEIASLYALISA